MSELSVLEPWCSRLIASDELAELLTILIHGNDQVASSSFVDSLTSQASAAKAENYRSLRWSIDPSLDKVWIMTVPPDNPEFIEGSAYIVVVRSGEVVAKHQLFAA
ncbi:MAG: hypothetical protein JWN70_923 [Planctomycetaceae bacterium]|nr:hypothetical protein [Planctomycetaceae bacterium]